MVLIEVFVNG